MPVSESSLECSANSVRSSNAHAGRGVVMQGLIRFQQRCVLLPDRDTIGPIGWTNCDITGVAPKTSSELRIADNDEGAGFRDLIKVGNSLCLRVAIMQRNATISRHFERDPIPYALETDWPVEAAGFEPLHLRIGIHQDSQPGGQDSNLRISNCRCADRTLKNELSGVQSTVQFSFGRDEVQQI